MYVKKECKDDKLFAKTNNASQEECNFIEPEDVSKKFAWALKQIPKPTTDNVIFPFTTQRDGYTVTNFNTEKLKDRITHDEVSQVFDSISLLPCYSISKNLADIRKQLVPKMILRLALCITAFIATSIAIYYNILFAACYIAVVIGTIYSMTSYRALLSKRVDKFLKKRHEIIAEKLASWNELKFVEIHEVQFSVGMLGSFIEVACVEGRPTEVVNFEFPPKIKTAKDAVSQCSTAASSLRSIEGSLGTNLVEAEDKPKGVRMRFN
jgi:hypothetical protein